MSTERIVLRAFGGDEGVAEELLARGFAPGLMETREGREVAQAMLDLRTAEAIPTLANLRQALTQRGSLRARLRRYLVQLEMTPRCSRLHAVAHLQLLKLDQAMAQVDNVCGRIAAQVEENGAAGKSAHLGPGQMAVPEPVLSVSRETPRTGAENEKGLRQEVAIAHPRAGA